MTRVESLPVDEIVERAPIAIQARLRVMLEAGVETMSIAARGFSEFVSGTASRKPDGSVLTATDVAVEEHLRARISQNFPEDTIIGEELGGGGQSPGEYWWLAERLLSPAGERSSVEMQASPASAACVWTIDPIDGTKLFVEGSDEFATLVSATLSDLDGWYSVGLVSFPSRGEMYVALEDSLLHVGSEGRARRDPLRPFTDAFAHMQVMLGNLPSRIDPDLALWDVVPVAIALRAAHGFGALLGVTEVSGRPERKCLVTACSAELLRKAVADAVRSGSALQPKIPV